MVNGRKIHNQTNPPLPQRKRADNKGNTYYRIAAKSGGATMILCKGMTENAANAFIDSVKSNITKLGGKLETNLIVIR